MIYRGTANSDYMQRIWSGLFLTLPPRTLAQVANTRPRHVDRDAVRRERRDAAAEVDRERDAAVASARWCSAAAARPAGRAARPAPFVATAGRRSPVSGR
jgi:hypothetical protein